jgi:hypothetical protein
VKAHGPSTKLRQTPSQVLEGNWHDELVPGDDRPSTAVVDRGGQQSVVPDTAGAAPEEYDKVLAAFRRDPWTGAAIAAGVGFVFALILTR